MESSKSKKMVAIEAEIASLTEKKDAISATIDKTQGFKPQSNDGKKAQNEAISQLNSQRESALNQISILTIKLEVETVAFLSGKDTDVADPTPADALKNAS